MSDELLTIDDVARLVHATPETVRRAIRRGELVATKPAGRLLVEQADFDRWKAAARVQPQVRVERPERAKSLPRGRGGDSVRSFMRQQNA